MEIERKFLIDRLPFASEDYPHKQLEQGYLSTSPVVRVRHEGDEFFLTYKSSGMMTRIEHNLPLTAESYAHLLAKADGYVIRKVRYYIPYESHTIELDLFEGDLAPLQMAEVEFDSEEEANAFCPPDWFGEEVTYSGSYHNSVLSLKGLPT
ncbi:MAG: CYTH domain-containing protein [Lachnospiraceae bacterium]|nr:CYTH domain-containing protein [Lachnospiraceae bacterium]